MELIYHQNLTCYIDNLLTFIFTDCGISKEL